jgi:hypothetical protein
MTEQTPAADQLAAELERYGRGLIAMAAAMRGEAPGAGPSLAEQVLALVMPLASDNAALSARMVALEARLPPPRFTIPRGWIGTKDAIARSGLSRSTIYRLIKKGRVLGIKVGAVTAVDPSTLPVRL